MSNKMVQKPDKSKMLAIEYCSKECEYSHSCWYLPTTPKCIKINEIINYINERW